YGGVMLIGAASGGHDPLRPLQGLGGEKAVAKLDFRIIKSSADLDRALAEAAAAGRMAMLDFYADWCVECKKMERYTFSEPSVAAALDGMLLIKADVTANDAADRELLNRFGIFGPPTIAFFDTSGSEARGFRQVGFAAASEFSGHVDRFREQTR
ncbi:MAG: thioredoxin family protein, partial [Gammaproteobacteria bacterium]